jgi:hypothetical protein
MVTSDSCARPQGISTPTGAPARAALRGTVAGLLLAIPASTCVTVCTPICWLSAAAVARERDHFVAQHRSWPDLVA